MMGLNVQHLDIKGWLYGFFHATIGGGASAVVGGFSASILKPSDFAFASTESLKLMGMMFVFNFCLSAFLYLKESPVPNIIEENTKRIAAIELRNAIKDNPTGEIKP
jgi:hypothetical protein